MFIYDLSTYKPCTFVNITSHVKDALKKSGVQNGIVLVYCPHTTAGITINENADPDVTADILAAMDKIIPEIDFMHMEGNSPAHIKTLLTGNAASIPVSGGALSLGRWQGIYFCEYDGPRDRKFYVQVIGE